MVKIFPIDKMRRMDVGHKIAVAVGAALTLAGCATTWQNPGIADAVAAKRQLTIDDGYCTLIAKGGSPSAPPIFVPSPTTSNVNMTGTAFNSATGTTTTSNYRGTVTTAPAGGFSGGFASGMANGAAIGAAIAAGQAEDKIHKACMYSRGWTDQPLAAVVPIMQTSLKASNLAPKAPASIQIYATSQQEWEADTREFLSMYPLYAGAPYFESLSAQVKRIAVTSPQLSGPEILQAARAVLYATRQGPEEPENYSQGLARQMYPGAVAGASLDQVGLGLLYHGGGEGVIADPKRAAYWVQKAAARGNPMAAATYGAMVFDGIGVPTDHIDGYRWVQKAAATDISARDLLAKMTSSMTADELRTARGH
ncbi:hypothetical protein [Rugamonas sp. DEMB1]|uniref:hypothetical protein n=1 Tax=Rugamonas sp. DEMB1 TaxID=3039386 RepID=UPI00244741B9|nr:hypothetical protein [Rugamonas sp. DEMB1]WGG52181.1 hypothetical protein QC826_08385 [Rugamonas sp. DEMB1]